MTWRWYSAHSASSTRCVFSTADSASTTPTSYEGGVSCASCSAFCVELVHDSHALKLRVRVLILGVDTGISESFEKVDKWEQSLIQNQCHHDQSCLSAC